MPLLVLVMLTLVLSVAAHAQEPRFVGPAGASQLWLPPAMESALRAVDSAFAPFGEAEYAPDLLAQYPADSRARPYAVLADFNGDGHRDVVMDGRSPTRVARIVLLSRESDYQALVLESRARDGRTAATPDEPPPRTVYLSYVPPGRVDSSPELEDTAIVLEHEAFQVEFWERAAVLYYWNGRAFSEYITGD